MKKVIFFTLLILSIVMMVSCGSGTREAYTDTISQATEKRFDALEVREYNGVQLDPSQGLRDNSISGTQYVSMQSYKLRITRLGEGDVALSYADVLQLPIYEKLITLYCVEGWDATILWKGALLKDIIAVAGFDETAKNVIFHCADNYTTSLPLQVILEKNMILAYASNNITLPASLGYPFIFVAEDKLGYKWARWVTSIELSDEEAYVGYWEKMGYDNVADVPEK